MHVRHLSLSDFRNYRRLELDLPAGLLLFLGRNAQGKTNLLEAVHLLSTIRSPRTTSDTDLINWDGIAGRPARWPASSPTLSAIPATSASK